MVGTAGAEAQAVRVSVTTLRLTAFRSYAEARLDLDPGRSLVVLTGDNGAGKTNVLEAVSLLAPGRGLRRAGLETLRRQEAGPQDKTAPTSEILPEAQARVQAWAVSADMRVGSNALKVGTGEDPSNAGRRLVKLDGQLMSQAEALGEAWTVTWLTPQMDRLFIEGPAARRRFLDRLVLGLHPLHGRQVSAYERLMRERNKLLSDGGGDAAWFEALEARMAEHAAAVAAARVDYCAQLAGQLAERDAMAGSEDVFPAPLIALEGDGEALALEGVMPVDVEAGLRARWAAERAGDRQVGRTRMGPHRSDMLVTHAQKGVVAELCSTGEQKGLLVAVMLAHARLLGALTGRLPILLLDEVAAHLDEKRRGALFSALGAIGGQVWLTGTDVQIFEGIAGAQAFAVTPGRVTPAS